MSSSPEMSVFHLRQGLLDCAHCRRTLRPETCRAYTCGQFVQFIYCRDCFRRHNCLAADMDSTCDLLNFYIAQLKFKCNCNKHIPYGDFLEHQRECVFAKYSKTPPAQWKECMLKTSLLQCSKCKVPLRPPVFSLWRGNHLSNLLICSTCYCADTGTYRHCTELEHLLEGITVKCTCKQYVLFSTLGSHQSDCLKSKLQNVTPCSSAQKKFCDDEETVRPMVGSNTIHDKDIVHGDEAGNDDRSCDDSHGTSEDVFSSEDDSVDTMDEGEEVDKPETVKRVTENAFKTPCDKKAKIATSYGQKTALPTAAQGSASPSQHQPSAAPSQRHPITAPRKPPPPLFVPRRPVTRSRTHPTKQASSRPNVKAPNTQWGQC